MPKEVFNGHNGQIYTCKFISGNKLATGSADRLIKIWDIQSRQCTEGLISTLLVYECLILFRYANSIRRFEMS